MLATTDWRGVHVLRFLVAGLAIVAIAVCAMPDLVRVVTTTRQDRIPAVRRKNQRLRIATPKQIKIAATIVNVFAAIARASRRCLRLRPGPNNHRLRR